MRTKWEIMEAQKAELEKKLHDLIAHMEWAAKTPFTANGTGKCSQCQEELKTEKDFWQHFVIPDERYNNLGECPNDRALKEKAENYFEGRAQW